MDLGRQTGSVNNHIMSRQTIGQPDATVGMGATILGWTDRFGATIISVETYRGSVLITVQEDTATRTDANGMSESQSYEYSPNLNGRTMTFRQGQSGRWNEVKLNAETNLWNMAEGGGYGLRIGERAHYHDYSF